MRSYFFITAVIVPFISHGQTKEIVSRFSYHHTVSFYGHVTISRVEDLFFDGHHSIFVVYAKDISKPADKHSFDKPSGGTVTMTLNVVDNPNDFVLYKDFTNGVMISNEMLENGNRCIVNDSIPKLRWELLSEKRQIGRYQCQKATASFRCAKYIVWFAAAVPLNIGPWKLSGLPGLIVEAIDERENVTYRYSLISAEYPSAKVSYAIAAPDNESARYQYNAYAKAQRTEAEKKRIFTSASAEDPKNAGYISIRPECFEGSK